MKISKEDLVLLSAYLDGELSPGQMTRVEKRVLDEEDLAAALDKLSRTRRILRTAPRLTAPRKFTLTPAMVGEDKKTSWMDAFQMLRLASAVAAVLLVALLGYDFGAVLQPTRLQEAAPPAALQEAAPSEEDRAESLAAPSPQPEEEAEAMMEPEAPAEEEKATGEFQEDAEEELTEQLREQPVIPEGEESAGREPPLERNGQIQKNSEKKSFDGWLRILEVVLAVSAVGLAGGAYYAREKAR